MSWLGRHGWQAQEYSVAERAQSYGRPLPDPTGPVAQAVRAAECGLIIARRPQTCSSRDESPTRAALTRKTR